MKNTDTPAKGNLSPNPPSAGAIRAVNLILDHVVGVCYETDKVHLLAAIIDRETVPPAKPDLIRSLRELLGYVQNGTSREIRISQDDATNDFVIYTKNGGTLGIGKDLSEAIIAARAAHQEE